MTQHIRTGCKERSETQYKVLEAYTLEWHCVLLTSSEGSVY